MGYNTQFSGSFTITPALSDEQIEYINLFHETRRMKRDKDILQALYQGKHGILGTTDYGPDGSYFACDDGDMWQRTDGSIIDTNSPITGLSLWCDWYINDQWELECEPGSAYEYQEWLRFMINHFFIPWGRYINGKVRWRGEEFDDMGAILIKDNIITIQ